MCVPGDTIILGWRKTTTIAHAFNDTAAFLQSAIAWRKHASIIKAQGVFSSIVINDIVTHEVEIIQVSISK